MIPFAYARSFINSDVSRDRWMNLFWHKMHQTFRSENDVEIRNRKCFCAYHEVIIHSVQNQPKFNLQTVVVVGSATVPRILVHSISIRVVRRLQLQPCGDRVFRMSKFLLLHLSHRRALEHTPSQPHLSSPPSNKYALFPLKRPCTQQKRHASYFAFTTGTKRNGWH